MALKIPALRDDLTLVETGKPSSPLALRDPMLGRSVGLDTLGAFVARALTEPRFALEILGSAHEQGQDRLDPVQLARRVRYLGRHGLLCGPRAEITRAALGTVPEPSHTHEELPLAFESGLRHRCQASGSCCSQTDVGPIEPSLVEQIESHDWTEHIEQLEEGEPLFREGAHEGCAVHLTRMRHEQCVFLAADRLCLVHRELGLPAKPTPCRQFPYVFSDRGDRIDVSLQMECRDYYAAARDAGPMEDDSEELRALLARGAPVHKVPGAVVVDDSFAISRERYLALEQRIIEEVRSLGPEGGPTGPLAAYAQACDDVLDDVYGPVMADETQYLALGSWRTAFPGSFPDDPDPWENFLDGLGRFHERVCEFTSQGAEIAARRGLGGLAQRFGTLERCVAAACGAVEPASFQVADPAAIHKIQQDTIVGMLYGKEAIRRGNLRFGLGLIGLRAWITWAGACNRAREACRVRLHNHDVIDTMVPIGKMLRERAVLGLLKELESTMISTFLGNLGVLLGTTAPRLQAAGGIR